jgi:drug/metabolite transporter superfamily protein YnfA
MDRAYGTHGGIREIFTSLWWNNLKERDNLEDLDVDRKIVLKLC